MTYKTKIKWRGKVHPVQEWARKRNVPDGYWYPAPCPLSDKPGGQKGRPVPYDNKKLRELLLLNGNNENQFKVVTRIGGWLFNSTRNKHLIKFLRKLLWWKDNYVPYPLPQGKKAFAEPIYCDGNEVVVDKVVGKWAHIKTGIAYLNQVEVGTGIMHKSNIRWKNPAGWLPVNLLERGK